jgi:hypothetical protein
VVLLAGFASVTWLSRRANSEAVRAADAESRLRIQTEIAMRDLAQGIAAARGGDIDQGLHCMMESLRKATAERPELIRLAATNLSAWGDSTIPLRAILEHQRMIGQAVFGADGKIAHQHKPLWCRVLARSPGHERRVDMIGKKI